jgi:hypothetical protein
MTGDDTSPVRREEEEAREQLLEAEAEARKTLEEAEQLEEDSPASEAEPPDE